jgi:hypothetical protein
MRDALIPGDVLTVTRLDPLARRTLFAIAKQIVARRRNSDHSRSRGPTPAPAPGLRQFRRSAQMLPALLRSAPALGGAGADKVGSTSAKPPNTAIMSRAAG